MTKGGKTRSVSARVGNKTYSARVLRSGTKKASGTSRRGFASMSAAKRKEIARMGGEARGRRADNERNDILTMMGLRRRR